MKTTLLTTLFLLNQFFSISQERAVINNLSNDKKIISVEQEKLIFDCIKSYPNNSQISISIIENGVPRYYGVKIHNDTVSFCDNYNKVFEIGSITKIFTSTLLANFVLNGKVKLDDNINGYLPFKLNNDIKITFKQLSNHTSGLPVWPNNTSLFAVNYTEIKLKEYLTTKMKLKHIQGKESYYSNVGVGILGYTLTKISNQDYETLLDSLILTKYNMLNSTTQLKKTANNLILGQNEKGGKNYENCEKLGAIIGCGGIISSVEDLSKFSIAQFDSTNHELTLTRNRTFTFEKTDKYNYGNGYGLGWNLYSIEPEIELFRHSGGMDGYKSNMIIEIKNKNGVIVLSNVSCNQKNASFINILAEDLLQTLIK